ncbi:MAG: DUF2911 domain-containing protein [Gemmatimonadales bacterium]
MHRATSLLALALLAPAAVPAQTGGFVVRLGQDTLAVERYTRTPELLQGEQVLRSPATVHRIYRAVIAPDGTVKSFELITHNIGGGTGPAEQRGSIDFRGDSAIVQVPRRDSMVTVRMATSAGALPYAGQTYALVELMAQRARAAGADSVVLQGVQIGPQQPTAITLRRRGRDSTTIQLGPIGPLAYRLDDGGRLAWVSGRGSTMQVDVERVGTIDIAALGPTFANRPLGTLSPSDSVKGTVAGAALAVRYARPSMRGRTIFGGVVPWNQVWRTGANAATILETSADLVMAGTPVPAGKYSLWTIPAPTGWTLIVNKNTGQWGTNYDVQYDLARLPMKVDRLAQPIEQFTIGIEPEGAGGVLKLEWETTRASVAIARR